MGTEPVYPIALGVLLDSRIQETWVLEAVRQCVAVPGLRLTTVGLVELEPEPSVAGRLHRVFDQIDERMRCRNERLLALTDVATALVLQPLLVDVVTQGDRWLPTATGFATLQGAAVDLWLCFCRRPPSALPRSLSRLGVWGLEVGDGLAASNPWAGAAELETGNPITVVSLIDYAAGSEDGVLYRSVGATATNSPRRNRLRALGKGMNFFRRLLERNGTEGNAWRPVRPATLPVPAARSGSPVPTFPALARVSRRLANSWLSRRSPVNQRLKQWQIAYHFTDAHETRPRFERLRYLEPPEGRYWADPIAVEHQGRYFIFFEEAITATDSGGRVMAIEVFENAEPGAVRVVIERPYHMSYPFVFDWNGVLYMLPETAERGTLELYRCESFPFKWSLDRVLLEDIRAFDATLFLQNDRWWMFVSIGEPGASSDDELHLFWSTTPFGPWTAHRRNPVVSDVRCARPAGPLFSSDGQLYRPSQDCSVAYGHSIVINRVDVLDEHAYQETPVDRIAPGWRDDILRVHTIGATKRLRVVDTMVRR